MNPLLADGIDFSFALELGLLVLIPLMTFEVLIEALVLKLMWKLEFRRLCLYTLVANLCSLAAGIPTKFLNALLYDSLLPQDLPSFFRWYPFVVGLGTLMFFVVTLAVEGAYAFPWLRRLGTPLQHALVWKGILLANLASYAVVAPIHYFATRPRSQIREFTNSIRRSANPTNTIYFVATSTKHLKAIRLDGSPSHTIVPLPVTDYLLSADLKLCLFRNRAGHLCLWRATGESNLIWETNERFSMNQVAFSPSGRLVAFASERSNRLEVVEVAAGRRCQLPVPFRIWDGSVAWSTEEPRFFTRGSDTNAFAEVLVQQGANLNVRLCKGTNLPPLLPCYGRVGGTRWFGDDDWGVVYSEDVRGDLHVWAEPGLGSGLRVYREPKERIPVLYLYVNPGLMHLARFRFEDTALLEGGRECLFSVNKYTYLLDIQEKRVGTLVHGDRFIMLAPRYQKRL